ncbi:hypothetical protein FE391_33200 [Nonomuraea sp. KC401]|uniref:SH3 domain-containing protein n=1 Tax=Nonomuraea longispora TaxID=1848320 RepID=A0A4R4MW73_9ACTN|nr:MULTISPECIES: hypothetical protein [Nonomuraea]NBE98584.1 hypothetical protein [Nonomuraea sp. K271]TDC00418.1 hypothetical protein E1267_34780 [Nonomuraea longispora]TLF60550.1 hypothetical protein FE391_33200 [Nonomuraea sp. KC401]
MGERKRIGLAVVGSLAVCAAMATAATPAAAGTAAASCYASSGNLYCDNAPAAIYAAPRYSRPNGNPERVVDRLLTTHSYFKCYVTGQQHGGGNNVWYHTYGDQTGAWGYVAAANVYTSVDPYPGVSRC